MEGWEPTCTVEALRARAEILGSIRAFFAERGVLEVQTPTLGRTSVTDTEIESLKTTGGDFLQTSPEYYMKRLLAAGAPSIYQIGPAYRAGESGQAHLTEFTLVEWYRLGFDDDALMAEVADLIDSVLGPEPYRRLTHAELLATRRGEAAEPDLQFVQAVENLGECRVFITDYPAGQAALARLRPDDSGVAARFELVVDGLELANGYHELTDAEELLERMCRDNRRRRERGRPEMEPDRRLLAAMHHGLPDCAGVALGLDRLVMLASGASEIATVVPFARH
ncbi:MAG: hypothetical protein OXP09_20755 [Gammaproteobacteria bacterium]|nr:hypothetical protein [Gammaproteobacteria bacterium]MDE0367986.1 hypothetical protein [Gammaproteobacteria bacterium]